jgi:hypothetical protein
MIGKPLTGIFNYCFKMESLNLPGVIGEIQKRGMSLDFNSCILLDQGDVLKAYL